MHHSLSTVGHSLSTFSHSYVDNAGMMMDMTTTVVVLVVAAPMPLMTPMQEQTHNKHQ